MRQGLYSLDILYSIFSLKIANLRDLVKNVLSHMPSFFKTDMLVYSSRPPGFCEPLMFSIVCILNL